jgi:mitogen-activated protein kinase 15
MFPGAPQDALDLLRKMLKFNPNHRITLEECLQHPFITAYSKKETSRASPPDLSQQLPANTNLSFMGCSTLLQDSKPNPVCLDFDNDV